MPDIVWVPLHENGNDVWHPMLRKNAERLKGWARPLFCDEPEGERVDGWERMVERLRAL